MPLTIFVFAFLGGMYLGLPFVQLAIAASLAGFSLETSSNWIIDDVVWKLLIGALIGIIAGKIIDKIIYALPNSTRLSLTGDGLIALGVTFIVNAVTEFSHGYGFLAIFLADLMLRKSSNGHECNKRLHDFADETERLIMMILLVFLAE